MTARTSYPPVAGATNQYDVPHGTAVVKED